MNNQYRNKIKEKLEKDFSVWKVTGIGYFILSGALLFLLNDFYGAMLLGIIGLICDLRHDINQRKD